MSNRLFWSRSTGSNASYNSYPFSLEFMNNLMNSTVVELIDPDAGAYTMLAPDLLETARTDTNGDAIDFHRIEGSGVVPWGNITLNRYHYDRDNDGSLVLESIVTAVLERVQ